MSPRDLRPALNSFLAALALAAAPPAALGLRPDAAGLEVDLLPTVSSAVAAGAEHWWSRVGGWGARVSP